MNVNWDDVLLAVKISGLSIIVLLLVLTLLAFIVGFLTRVIKEEPEEEEDNGNTDEEISSSASTEQSDDLARIAAIALSIVRAQPEFANSGESSASALNSWGQFHRNRRLNLSSSIRRSK